MVHPVAPPTAIYGWYTVERKLGPRDVVVKLVEVDVDVEVDVEVVGDVVVDNDGPDVVVDEDDGPVVVEEDDVLDEVDGVPTADWVSTNAWPAITSVAVR